MSVYTVIYPACSRAQECRKIPEGGHSQHHNIGELHYSAGLDVSSLYLFLSFPEDVETDPAGFDGVYIYYRHPGAKKDSS